MSVDKDTVRRIAKLARLAVPESRLEPMAGELNGIFQWVEMLGEGQCRRRARHDIGGGAETEMARGQGYPTAARSTRCWPMPRKAKIISSSCPR